MRAACARTEKKSADYEKSNKEMKNRVLPKWFPSRTCRRNVLRKGKLCGELGVYFLAKEEAKS
jgi:hypothetical protein